MADRIHKLLERFTRSFTARVEQATPWRMVAIREPDGGGLLVRLPQRLVDIAGYRNGLPITIREMEVTEKDRVRYGLFIEEEECTK